MVDQHYQELDKEYCFAEGGGVTRIGGQVKYAGIATLEKIPYAIELTAKGVAGHGSVPPGPTPSFTWRMRSAASGVGSPTSG